MFYSCINAKKNVLQLHKLQEKAKKKERLTTEDVKQLKVYKISQVACCHLLFVFFSKN